MSLMHLQALDVTVYAEREPTLQPRFLCAMLKDETGAEVGCVLSQFTAEKSLLSLFEKMLKAMAPQHQLQPLVDIITLPKASYYVLLGEQLPELKLNHVFRTHALAELQRNPKLKAAAWAVMQQVMRSVEA